MTPDRVPLDQHPDASRARPRVLKLPKSEAVECYSMVKCSTRACFPVHLEDVFVTNLERSLIVVEDLGNFVILFRRLQVT